jgi:hypothetical protein
VKGAERRALGWRSSHLKCSLVARGREGKRGGRRGHVRVEAGEGGEMEARQARMVPLSSNRGGQRGTGDAA